MGSGVGFDHLQGFINFLILHADEKRHVLAT